MSAPRRARRGGKPVVTASDRETARQLCDALVVTRRTANVDEVARILAFVREQILACARVDAAYEREQAVEKHAAWCRTDGCDGSCRDADVEETVAEPWRELSVEEQRELRGALVLLTGEALAHQGHRAGADREEAIATIKAAQARIAKALGFETTRHRRTKKGAR